MSSIAQATRRYLESTITLRVYVLAALTIIVCRVLGEATGVSWIIFALLAYAALKSIGYVAADAIARASDREIAEIRRMLALPERDA